MADLSAVLRKTIDALPAATPQLRAKVYDKARAAVQRQIASADPPLSRELADARERALEGAIAATEAHYANGGSAPEPAAARPAPDAAPAVPPAAPHAPRAPEPPRPLEAQRNSFDQTPSPPPPLPVAPRPPFDAPEITRSPEPIRPEPIRPEPQAGASREHPRQSLAPTPPERHDERFDHARETSSVPLRENAGSRVGEIGPMSELPPAAPATGDFGTHANSIPEADLTAPNYARPRRASRSSGPFVLGTLALLFIGSLGAAGYLYRDEISAALNGTETTAATGAEEPVISDDAAVETATGEPAPGDEVAQPEPAASDPSARQFTQRLLPDGTEVDEGPASSTANAFDEGTDIATASLLADEAASLEAAPPTPTAEPVPAPAQAGAEPSDAVPVAQRAIFYEERSADRAGSQRGGNVVWSVVNEPPAAGRPPEPAIRAVAEVPETNLRMTMTIRRNADNTLPASHVIEILFDTPADFEGGEIENVQRLALKPTEQDRGEPLIGVAGKISDGFFIIALNDLDQAVENNLALMTNQQWIDIPMAYASGQRALMSLEKGIPGERVFREAIDAWAQSSG